MGQILKLTETYLVRHARTEAAQKLALAKAHPLTKGLMLTDTETQIQRDSETHPEPPPPPIHTH